MTSHRQKYTSKNLSLSFTGKQLAHSPYFYKEIKTIQSLVALPDEYYSIFYQPPLNNLLAIYQVIDKEHMQLKLHGIIKALKIRRSHNLPIGVKPEDVREKKDVWTYTIFVAGLLYNLPDITQYKVLCKPPKSEQGYIHWNPYLGAIKEGYYYQTQKISDSDTNLISLTLFPVIFSQQCITWLYSDSDAFSSTLELITSPSQESTLGHLIISSHNESSYYSQQEHIGHDLYKLITNAMNGKLSKSDKLHNYLCLTHDGYAIAIPDIFHYYSTIKDEDSKMVEGCFYSLDVHKPSTYKVTFPNIGKKEALLLIDNDKTSL